MKRLLLFALPILALTAFAACSSGDSTSATKTVAASTTSASTSSASDVRDTENTVTQLGATTAADIDFFIAHTTTNFLSQNGFGGEASCRANASACIGSASTVSNFTNTTVTGDTATTTALFKSGTTTQTLEVQLVRENGVWKVDSAQPVTVAAASPTG